ncbi:Isochorismatase hydrolase [Hortaea werneckii]|nr:Isochorismatase hydrolase [Hortaea werneckii]KAI7013456.1 Isochorismatase hydrolase [Hortaea werneckii]KAI7173181.1 Isochorismatase hydrolase [Hortaea werneckii]KAI7577043.1 Isochorismatase hydrolase [Hortaea werneckii]KAI7672910.1 Isochorismatase hydrolase [Hortaea werneckii]
MKLLRAFFAATAFTTAVLADAVPFERLNKTDALLVVLDLQDGLFGLARDFDPTVYYNAMMAHAAVGKLFDLPVIMSTSAQTGPNGPLPKAILEMYPDAPLVERQGEVDAWDNAAFRQAVRETRRKQVIVAGITTDVCTTFLALSLRAEGYGVWANVEASGTTTELIRDVSNDRMARAGVQLVSLFAIIGELMRDWRGNPGADTVIPWLAKYYPVFGRVAGAHGAAVLNGSLIPGQAALLPESFGTSDVRIS